MSSALDGSRRVCRFVAALVLLWSGGPAAADQEQDRARTLAERVEQLERQLKRERREAEVDRGAKIFARACATCHGREGRGDGPGARDLEPAPRDLTSRQVRFRSTASGEPPRPEDLERTIRNGLPGSSMPAFGRLFSDRELASLIRFIYSLRPDADNTTVPPAALPVSPVDPPDSSSVEEGRAVYLLAGCWRCHGVDGAGRGPSAAHLTDENEQPIRVTDFRYDPYKGGREPREVVRSLLTGLNGSPMPSYGDAMLIAADEATDLPPGERLASTDRETVEQFLRSAPTRSTLDAMEDEQRARLRDRRLAALSHYVLSLGRRRGPGYWLFHEEPEREARSP